MARKSLNAGFTGDVTDDKSMSTRARTALVKAKDEAGMVATHAVDHPAITGSALATIGIFGLAIGYLIGATSASRRGNW